MNPELLKNRTLFPVSEFGLDPIYTKETFPIENAVEGKDLFDFDFNYDRLHPSESIDYYKWCKDIIYNMDHGQIYETSHDNSLSTDVVATTIHGLSIATINGLGEFYWDNNRYTKLNKAGGKIPYHPEGVKMLNNQIQRFNRKYNLHVGYALFIAPGETLPKRDYSLDHQSSILVPVMGFRRY